jgi:hypothetical protein
MLGLDPSIQRASLWGFQPLDPRVKPEDDERTDQAPEVTGGQV